MGSSCSSGQGHNDKDSGSTRSEESPSYQVAHKVEGSGVKSGVVLEVAVEARKQSAKAVLPSLSDTASPSSPAPVEKSPPPPAFVPLIPTLPSPVTSRLAKIVLYICAADSQDCKVEKSVLHNEVYPELRGYCRERGFELHIVDLHWSIQEANPEPAELCLHELHSQSERAYLVPVVLLNSSLGAPLLPKTIESADFEMVSAASGSDSVLGKWYARDTHAQPPCYRLLPAAHHIPGFKSELKEEKDRAVEEWRREVEKILSVMLTAFSQELRDTYLTTVVEQEVHNTVLMSQELAKRCVWISRVMTHVSEDRATPTGPGETELKRRLDSLQKGLKSELSESHIVRLTVKWSAGGIEPSNVEHAQYLAQVAAVARKQLTAVVDNIMEEHLTKVAVKDPDGVPGWLIDEMWAQRQWAERSAQCSVNRQAVLQQINKLEGGSIVVVSGCEGSGKTTLAARLAQSVIPPSRLIFRAANLTCMSSSPAGILLSVILHARLLASSLIYDHPPIPHNVASYAKVLPEVFNAAAGDEQLVVIIDGLDQIREFGGSDVISWIPDKLSEKVKLVLTLGDTSAVLCSLRNRFGSSPCAHFIQVGDLDKAEAESILVSSVMEYNHSVNSHVQDCVLTSVKQCTLPLYVKVLAWQTSWCSEFEHQLQPQGDLQKQLAALLSDLETICGKKLVEMCLSLLTAAKWGLTDSEMVDLLTSNRDFHTSTTYLDWAGACVFWSVIKKQLWPLLRWGGNGTVTWRDWALRRAVLKRYSTTMPTAHSTLFAYFSGELWKEESNIKARTMTQPNKFGKVFNRRKLEELPYQAFKMKGTCREYLTDHVWLFEKLCGSTVYQVIEDLEMEGRRDDKHLSWLRELFEKSASSLEYDGRQLYSVVSRHPSSCPAARQLQTIAADPPVPSLVILPVEQAEDEATGNPNEKRFDSIVRLPSNPNHVVTISTQRGEIAVWDIVKSERVRTLKGIPQPISLQMIDNYKCVVLCSRELRTYDLNTGVLITKLKGVMNQKMPYYGLHDAMHLVALSRNRMYVNLMNLETGDLVTTFKAGEDRFLNSLLVSGDGRMLVCGDETQKPFPLLVWNLAVRKLLYDLRIPGHDFVTSLSAITHTGSYVAVVATEVDDPSAPNFLVVYDLGSGTLFKKWKPGVGTTAVAISSADSCVASGHDDGSLLVWDLVTGACRSRLAGHRGRVTSLSLQASLCLSTDATRSLRLWRLGDKVGCEEESAVYCCETECESLLTGSRVVLAPRNSSRLTCLQLLPPPPDGGGEGAVYGLEENRGKVFTIEER